MTKVLYSPDGVAVRTSVAAEVVRLRAHGYTEEPRFDPSEHKVQDVLEYVEEHPEEAPVVVAAERRGKDRKTITDS